MSLAIVIELLQKVQEPTPLFSNDQAGLMRFLVAGSVVISPIFGLVIWWMRRGPMDAIKTVSRDVTNIGEKVDNLDRLAGQRGTKAEELKDRVTRAEGNIEQNHDAIVELSADFKAMHALMADNHRDLTALLMDSGKKQLDAVHAIDRQVAVLNDRSDISACLEKLGDNMERTVRLILEERGNGTR